MPTHRREQTVALAQALGLELMSGEATGDLMDRCIERAGELGARDEGARPVKESRGRRNEESELLPENLTAAAKAGDVRLSGGKNGGRRRRRSREVAASL